MDKKDAKQKIEDLINKLNEYARLYYEEDSPVISDAAYDILYRELEELEEQYPSLKRFDSPTQRVGGKALDGFMKVTHKYPALSLTDAFDYDELRSFDERVRKVVANPTYCVENKFDGLTVVLTYENGLFVRGATRGDGVTGEDVTENIKTIKNVPLKLKENENVIVRAEVFVPKKSFEKINKKREEEGLPLFANCRNLAAGSLRQLDPKLAAKRGLDVAVFNLEEGENAPPSHSQALLWLEKLGFKVSGVKKCGNIEEVITQIEALGEKRESLAFDIDGAVVKVDSFEDQKLLGTTSKVPRYQIAYKYDAEEKLTKINSIVFQVGRTGVVTPVAEFAPVRVAGSLVSRATLHNEDYVKEKDIKIHDWVYIRKAGDVIPEVLRVEKEKRDSTQQNFSMPSRCPVCQSELKRVDGEAATKCLNPSCSAKKLGSLVYFASKDAYNIEGLGEKVVTRLFEDGIIQDSSHIFTLKDKYDALVTKEGFGKKSVDNLLKAIEKSKANDFYRFIAALGIPFVGIATSKLLASHFRSMEHLMNASEEELSFVNEVGEKIAGGIYSYFRDPSNRELVEKLMSLGLNSREILKEDSTLRLNKMTFVLSGTLPTLSREEATELIEKNGGKVSSSVSKKTSALLLGENSGSKAVRAKELGIRIITEEELLNDIKG